MMTVGHEMRLQTSTVSICMPLFSSVLNTCYFAVFLVTQYNKNSKVSVCLFQNMHIFCHPVVLLS